MSYFINTDLNYKIISIEGNIGSGKTTLLQNLKNEYNNNSQVIFLKEPVDEWKNIKDSNGITILEKFYLDQQKYSFAFQMMAYISRLNLLCEHLKKLDPSKKYIIITERSLNTDKYVFAKMLFESGKMEDVCYQIYLNWFDTFSKNLPINKIIYVKTQPEICYNRIKKRSREGENTIALDYLIKCSNYHDDMLDVVNKNSEKLILNGNIDIYDNANQLNNWIHEIHKFIFENK
jgi:deoxyadenosine/deoxycytidine kinase